MIDPRVWVKVSEQHPKPHARYLVCRDGVLMTATPCYGLHHPWWVVRVQQEHSLVELPPIAMLDNDEWTISERVK